MSIAGPVQARAVANRFEAAAGLTAGALVVLGGFVLLSMTLDLMSWVTAPEATSLVRLGLAAGLTILTAGAGLIVFGGATLKGAHRLSRAGLGLFGASVLGVLIVALWYALTMAEPVLWMNVALLITVLFVLGGVGVILWRAILRRVRATGPGRR